MLSLVISIIILLRVKYNNIKERDVLIPSRSIQVRCSGLAFPHLSKALAAEYGTIGLGLKGNLCLAAAGCTNCGKELAGSTGCILACVTAGLAALGLILETALCIELLLTCGEHELLTTFLAY